MGFLDRLFQGRTSQAAEKQVQKYFKMLNAYQPVFTSLEGGIYEMELTRAAIHSFATHISKLTPIISGSGNEAFARRMQTQPNPHMVTSQYLYKLATMYMIDNTAFIMPLFENDAKTICGYYPIRAMSVTLVQDHGKEFYRFQLPAGNFAIEREKVGVLNQFLLNSDIFGENNEALRPTMELLNTTNQGIINGVRNSANIRFLAKLGMALNPEDQRAERERLTEENLGPENNSGILLFDQRYEDVKQVTAQWYVVNPKQVELIRQNVFYYFGTNEKILNNEYTSAQWAAYYEGKIEPFAVQLSLVHTAMTFTEKQQAYGNNIIFTTNRLQYLSPDEKLNTVTQLFDRGFLTHNEGREIYNMPTRDDGDKYYIRKEYAEVSKLDGGGNGDAQTGTVPDDAAHGDQGAE